MIGEKFLMKKLFMNMKIKAHIIVNPIQSSLHSDSKKKTEQYPKRPYNMRIWYISINNVELMRVPLTVV